MWPNPHIPVDLATFTEEILNGKLPFLCSVHHSIQTINSGKSTRLLSFNPEERMITVSERHCP